MDSDELSEMAYECIRLAREASGSLGAFMGAACPDFSREDDWLRHVANLLSSVRNDPAEFLEEWESDEGIDPSDFSSRLDQILKHVKRTLATPQELRGRPAI